MSLPVRIDPRASSDADAIFDWIAARSPAGAATWYAAFLTAAQDLSRSSLRHSLAPEGEVVGREIRQRFFQTRRGRVYRLLFTVTAAEIRVLRVRGPGQPPVTPSEIGA